MPQQSFLCITRISMHEWRCLSNISLSQIAHEVSKYNVYLCKAFYALLESACMNGAVFVTFHFLKLLMKCQSTMYIYVTSPV